MNLQSKILNTSLKDNDLAIKNMTFEAVYVDHGTLVPDTIEMFKPDVDFYSLMISLAV